MHYDLAIIGFIAEDFKFFPSKSTPDISLGGGILYGGLAAANFNPKLNIFLITKASASFSEQNHPFFSHPAFKGCLILRNCAYTTQYELDYTLPERKLRLRHSAAPFQFSEIPSSFWNTDVLLLTPIAKEFTPLFVANLATLVNKGTLIGFDLQGILRNFDEEGNITLGCDLACQTSLLEFCHSLNSSLFLKMDLYEAMAFSNTDSLETVIIFLQTLPVHSFVTLGLKGLHYITPEGACYFFDPILPTKIEDETGAGDTFLAVFLMEILCQKKENKTTLITHPMIFEAIRVASAGASFVVEKSGLAGFEARSRIKKRLELQ